MKIMTWNIKHGGSRSKLNDILSNIIEKNADIIVLTEYRIDNGNEINTNLLAKGWMYQASSNLPVKTNGIYIASKYEFHNSIVDYKLPQASHRWLDIALKDFDLRILGIHIPGAGDKWGKEDFWKAVVEFGRLKRNEKILMIGDFNTGLDIDAEGTLFQFSEYMINMNEMGWTDAWRFKNSLVKEYTWYSKSGNGFRLDYAYLSPSLKEGLINVLHSHQERIRTLSDHSSLCVELNVNNCSRVREARLG